MPVRCLSWRPLWFTGRIKSYPYISNQLLIQSRKKITDRYVLSRYHFSTSSPNFFARNVDSGKNKRSQSTLYYLGALGVLVVGASYAAVPLYRIFCQVIHN